MRLTQRLAFTPLLSCTLALSGFATGCNARNEVLEESPAETARQAVGADAVESQEKTTEVSRDVIVEKTTKVIDQKSGEVISTEKDVTPVTVQREKKVDTDVNVKVGDTTKSVDH